MALFRKEFTLYVEATVLLETVGNFNQTVQGLISEDGIIMWTPLHSQISQFLKLFQRLNLVADRWKGGQRGRRTDNTYVLSATKASSLSRQPSQTRCS